MVKVTISAAGKPPAVARGLPFIVEIPAKSISEVTVGDVKKSLAEKFPKFYTTRQKLSLRGSKTPLADDATLKDFGAEDGAELIIKDLGPQIGWRAVYLIEYIGPLFIHPMIYHLTRLFYGTEIRHSRLQQCIYAFVMLHFLKRVLETIFVHRFSHATMPFTNVFKNSAHYHLLSGVALAYAIYSPTYSATSSYIRRTIRDNPIFLRVGATVWLIAELSNLHTHLTLRALRPSGTRTRAIPYGYGFSLVSCPNYFFEMLAWAVVAGMTGSWVAMVFLAIGTGQMAIWASKKHAAYKKDFGKDYPRGRKAMIPFLF